MNDSPYANREIDTKFDEAFGRMKHFKAAAGIPLMAVIALAVPVIFGFVSWTMISVNKTTSDISLLQTANAATQQEVTDQAATLSDIKAEVNTLNTNVQTLLISQGLPFKK